jgi:arginine/lysine/ornithine decarboxylase
MSALDAGADLVMHSTHKVLTAMTQAAMLDLNQGSAVSPSRVSKALQVGLTSGQSCVLQ